MDDLSKSRLATNEKTFREENERVGRMLHIVVKPSDKIYFVCECSGIDCKERIPLTAAKFKDLHKSPRLFIIKPNHETVEIEEVVEKTDSYWIVEKFVEPQ